MLPAANALPIVNNLSSTLQSRLPKTICLNVDNKLLVRKVRYAGANTASHQSASPQHSPTLQPAASDPVAALIVTQRARFRILICKISPFAQHDENLGKKHPAVLHNYVLYAVAKQWAWLSTTAPHLSTLEQALLFTLLSLLQGRRIAVVT